MYIYTIEKNRIELVNLGNSSLVYVLGMCTLYQGKKKTCFKHQNFTSLMNASDNVLGTIGIQSLDLDTSVIEWDMPIGLCILKSVKVFLWKNLWT